MKKKTIWIIVGVVVLVLAGAIIFTQVGGTNVDNNGEAFLIAIRDEDLDTAYALCSEDLQASLGGAEYLEFYFDPGVAQMTSYEFTLTQSAMEDGRSATLMSGTAYIKPDFTSQFDIWLIREKGEAKVARFVFQDPVRLNTPTAPVSPAE